MSSIVIQIYEPGKEPHVSFVNNDLPAMQKLVVGYIESLTIDERLVLICNEEGRFMETCPKNRIIRIPKRGTHQIHGTFFICAYTSDGEFSSITDDDLEPCRLMTEPCRGW